jgi:hypothetical protein
MTKRAREKIAAGLREAIAVAHGEERLARLQAPAEIPETTPTPNGAAKILIQNDEMRK